MKYENDEIQKNKWLNHWKDLTDLEKAKNKLTERKFLINRINLYINEINISKGRINRIRVISKLYNCIFDHFNVIKNFNNEFFHVMYYKIYSFYPMWQGSIYFRSKLENKIREYKGNAYLDDIIYDMNII
jgi:hypothetical protein